MKSMIREQKISTCASFSFQLRTLFFNQIFFAIITYQMHDFLTKISTLILLLFLFLCIENALYVHLCMSDCGFYSLVLCCHLEKVRSYKRFQKENRFKVKKTKKKHSNTSIEREWERELVLCWSSFDNSLLLLSVYTVSKNVIHHLVFYYIHNAFIVFLPLHPFRSFLFSAFFAVFPSHFCTHSQPILLFKF